MFRLLHLYKKLGKETDYEHEFYCVTKRSLFSLYNDDSLYILSAQDINKEKFFKENHSLKIVYENGCEEIKKEMDDFKEGLMLTEKV